MSGTDFVVEPDRWSLQRRPRFRLRSTRILPGPLKSLPRRRTASVRLAGLGLAGLSLAAALAFAPLLSGREAPSRPAEPVVAESALAPRIVGALPAASPTLETRPVAESAAVSEPSLRTSVAEPVSDPVPAQPHPPATQRAAAPALDLAQLPVLELDAAAFEAPHAAEPTPRPAAKPARTPGPRLAGQP